MKAALRAGLAGSGWVHHLPLVMLGLLAAPKDDSDFSPAEAVYGSHGVYIKTSFYAANSISLSNGNPSYFLNFKSSCFKV